MSKLLTAGAQISFGGSESGMRLEEDSDRSTSPETRDLGNGNSVSCQIVKYLRLYPPASSTTVVVAGTGSVSYMGNATSLDDVEIVTFSPDSPSKAFSRGVKNVRIEQVGAAFLKDGKSTAVKVVYDPVENKLRVNPPSYCAVKVMFDSEYSLYTYRFAGACPDIPDTQVDSLGNPLDPLSVKITKYFQDGLVSALDPVSEAFASIHLDSPKCEYSSVSMSFNDSDRDKVVPTLKMEIDSDYPARIVAGGSDLTAECSVRVYPAGIGATAFATSGVLTKNSVGGNRQIAEVKTFSNSAVASLNYPPAGSVALEIVGTLQTISGGSASSVRGPGETVTDVTYIPNGGGRYTNPRTRRLGPNEIAVTDMFGHPIPCHGSVVAKYTSMYDVYIFTFDKSVENGATEFEPAFAVVTDSQGRATSVRLEPPSTKDKTKSAR